MKLNTFLAMYKNIIVLIWWIVILIIFKVTINFEFSGGNSILFVTLLIVLPLALYIYGVICKKKLLKKKLAKKEPFFNIIKKDLNNKKFQKEFLDKLVGYNFTLNKKEEFIRLYNDVVDINFDKNFACIMLIGTNVIFRYYYISKIKEFSKYDKRLIQYYSTLYLYKLILEKLDSITNKTLLYFENKKGCILLDEKNQEVIYSTFIKNINTKKLKVTKKIILTKHLD